MPPEPTPDEPMVSPYSLLPITLDLTRIQQAYWTGLYKYANEFMLPFWTALHAFAATEAEKLLRHHLQDSIADYLELLQFNLQQADAALRGGLDTVTGYHARQAGAAWTAALEAAQSFRLAPLEAYLSRQADVFETLVYAYPEAIRAVRSEYGFHFGTNGIVLAGETDRFQLYQVLPSNDCPLRKDGKPVLIIPPFVLGPNILAFLPGEQRSYVHAFANQGIPTYIRILKNIDDTPAVQTITGEDDVLDTRTFCEQLRDRHGRAVTLNGFCQGGFMAMLAVLTGELDETVDALTTCVAPIDGSRSHALVDYMQHLPPRFRDLGYAVKSLPNGNRVVDGKVMSWVYKLKSIEREAPVHALYRDLLMFDRQPGPDIRISKTAAAINHWLIYDRHDLPEAITRLSFDSYTRPIAEDGALPIKLFGRALNLNRLNQVPLSVLICIAEDDDLVDREAALAPADYAEVEVTCFPKGHGAIATSWSHPDSACALHKTFGDGMRGPVRFHLDLEDAR